MADAPRLSFANDLVKTYMSNNQANQGKVDEARTKLIDYYSGLEDPLTRFTKLSEEQGVTQQQQLVNSLTKDVMTSQDLLDSLEGSVNTRTKDFLVNDADRTAILAKERYPVEQNLTKLLRAKQYEEVGLAGKQQLVQNLLSLSLQGDEMRAKPLQLGVDYTTQDRDVARSILSDVMGLQFNAFSGDQSAEEQRQEAEKNRAFQREMDAINAARSESSSKASFSNQVALENLRSSNDLKNSLALKAAGGSGTSAEKKQFTEDTWNKILSESKTAGDVYTKIKENEPALKSAGADVGSLYSNYYSLAGKVGTGGTIRTEKEDKLEAFRSAILNIPYTGK